MIDVYYFPSPNTWKVTIMLEECALPYRIVPVDTLAGDQRSPAFVRINPNGKVPAIVDHDTPEGNLALFDSGAILIYLAEKTGRLLPTSGRAKTTVLQWLFWQMSGLGPMAGQVHYFAKATPPNPAAVDRFVTEVRRLYGVMNGRLAEREYLAGAYSIADIACFGWVWFHELHQQDLAEYPHVARWFDSVGARPAVIAGRRVGLDLVPEEHRGVLEPKRSANVPVRSPTDTKDART